MVIVSGWLYVDPDVRAGYLDGCRTVLERARSAPGCLDYELSADLVEPGRINVYERWESDEHLERFRGSGTDSTQTALVQDAAVAKYRVAL